MSYVIFVGDRPSPENYYETLPFVGTKSFTNLVKWIKELSPDYYLVTNSFSMTDTFFLKDTKNIGFKFVALGNEASKKLKQLEIKHFTLPHPSPKNRKLNDKEYIKQELKRCKEFIHA